MKSFKEDLNTAVITTKFVLEKKSPILYVFHYEEDESWQFSGDETNLMDEDFRVVSLEEIISLDSTVLEIADLPLGGEAYRVNINASWEIQ
ncbi:hypothetical protein LF887_17195 [Chryseobacterium sp. MEBOG06]|uniref:hypothetical protein n=1 Tax=Chryseobacterium sp. MEBOG06 TaxID=2879938 RepID=UPI001F3CA78D|nr:hypothetical protein [Chryseobacterium sp. MEBOG06]UKB82739.1 hypothetical protein LF887_17195 [Chryseobacterium sp. MEBOG06]